jgi:hypothetical protein
MKKADKIPDYCFILEVVPGKTLTYRYVSWDIEMLGDSQWKTLKDICESTNLAVLKRHAKQDAKYFQLEHSFAKCWEQQLQKMLEQLADRAGMIIS